MPIKVNEQSTAVAEMACEWPRLEALQGGTPAMRKAGVKFQPKWPGESDEAYRCRLETATLFPAYQRTVNVMAGKPFSKALTLDDAPPLLEAAAENIDNQGVNLHSFCAEMFRETVGYGYGGILVDYPDARPRDAAGVVIDGPVPTETMAQREASGKRPYFVRIHHNQVLGWRSEMIAGRLKLTMLRLLESREEPDGEWGTKSVPVVRVLVPGGWSTWEERASQDGKVKEWQQTDAGMTTLADIPFVPLYGVRLGFMVGKAPLLDLAYLNVKHWQSQSDQDTLMHVARVPILVTKACGDKFQLVVGGSTSVDLGDSPDADMRFVEHTGAAIGAGETSLAALEDQMVQTGAELMVKKPGDRTATESANDAEGNKSDLQRMAETFEDAVDQALVYFAQYAGIPEGASISLFKDYGAATLSDASAQLIKDLQQGGLISKETAIKELQRRGVLDSGIDPADELAAAEADGPSLGTMLAASLPGMGPDGKPLSADPNAPFGKPDPNAP